MVESCTSFALFPTIEDHVLSETKSNLGYMSYAVHVSPGRKLDATSVQVDISHRNGCLSNYNSEQCLKNEEVNSANLATNNSSFSSFPKPAWHIHPSLKTLLGDFCVDLDMHEPLQQRFCNEASSSNGTKKDVSPLCSALAHKLSICAPEFVPSFPKPKLFKPGADLHVNSLIAAQVPKVTTTQPRMIPLTPEPTKYGQYSEMKDNTYSFDTSSYSPEHFKNGHDLSDSPEERDLISFDGDGSPFSEHSLGVKPFSPKPSMPSKDLQLNVSSFNGPDTFQYCTTSIDQQESAGLNRDVFFEYIVSSKPFEAPPHSPFHHEEQQHEEKISKKAVKAVPDAERFEESPVVAEEKQSRTSTFKRPVFKTYADAANFYYSLLEEQSREKLFEGASAPQALESVSSTRLPPPPGLEVTPGHPNWPAVPEEGFVGEMQQPIPRHSNQSNYEASLCTNAEGVHEDLASIQSGYMVDNFKPIRSPSIRREQPSRQSSNGNGYDEPEHYFSKRNHILEANSFCGSPRSAGTYSMSDQGDKNEYSNRKKGRFPIRSGVSASDLEREIDEYHENLRVKANRASQGQSHRAKEHGGSGRGRGRRRFSREEEGFDDPVSPAGELGWGMDNSSANWD